MHGPERSHEKKAEYLTGVYVSEELAGKFTYEM